MSNAMKIVETSPVTDSNLSMRVEKDGLRSQLVNLKLSTVLASLQVSLSSGQQYVSEINKYADAVLLTTGAVWNPLTDLNSQIFRPMLLNKDLTKFDLSTVSTVFTNLTHKKARLEASGSLVYSCNLSNLRLDVNVQTFLNNVSARLVNYLNEPISLTDSYGLFQDIISRLEDRVITALTIKLGTYNTMNTDYQLEKTDVIMLVNTMNVSNLIFSSILNGNVDTVVYLFIKLLVVFYGNIIDNSEVFRPSRSIEVSRSYTFPQTNNNQNKGKMTVISENANSLLLLLTIIDELVDLKLAD